MTQEPPSEHDQLAHIVEVEIPAYERRISALEKALQSAYTYREAIEGLPAGTLRGPL